MRPELEAECARAAKTKNPILLVGPTRDELEKTARRIHELAHPDNPDHYYDTVQCRGLPADFVLPHKVLAPRNRPSLTVEGRDTAVVSQTRPSALDSLLVSQFTLHLADVESASDEVAWGIFTTLERRHSFFGGDNKARVVASTTTPLEKWPSTPLLDLLRHCSRIDVAVTAGRGHEDDEFKHNGTYTEVTLKDETFELNAKEAIIISLLNEARLDRGGNGWVHKDRIAEQVESEAKQFEVRDSFSGPDRVRYRKLVEAKSSGHYRLRAKRPWE